MFPFPFEGLRLVHDEKVFDAMEQARIDAELARDPLRIVRLSLFRNLLVRIRSKLNILAVIEHLRRLPRVLAKGVTRDSR